MEILISITAALLLREVLLTALNRVSFRSLSLLTARFAVSLSLTRFHLLFLNPFHFFPKGLYFVLQLFKVKRLVLRCT